MTGRSNTLSTRETMHGRDTFYGSPAGCALREPDQQVSLQHKVSQLGNTPLCVSRLRRAGHSETLNGSLNRPLRNSLQAVISSG